MFMLCLNTARDIDKEESWIVVHLSLWSSRGQHPSVNTSVVILHLWNSCNELFISWKNVHLLLKVIVAIQGIILWDAIMSQL